MNLRPWLGAARVPTLPAAVVPVLVGSALAQHDHVFHPLRFAATLVGAVCIQIGTNLVNDYFDHVSGADTAERVGPRRITGSGSVRPRTVLTVGLISFLIAALIGVYLTISVGWPIIVIGVLSIAAGIAYTGGPYPLGYHGLGDVFVFIFFGLVAVVGSFYVETLRITTPVVVVALPVGFLVTAILVINNLRDAETDLKAGKMTLAARFGRPFAQRQFDGLVIGAYVFPVVLVATHAASAATFWLPYLSLPVAIQLLRRVVPKQSPVILNQSLRQMGLLHLAFGLLLAASIL